MEFIQAMDEATKQTRVFENVHQFLMDKAKPVTSSLRVLEQNNDQYQENVLDVENYALKYVGCQNINTWSDNKAQDADSDTVFAMQRFVVFRMCPVGRCSAHNAHGCNSDFGEYMITMEDYLAIMAQYHFARFDEYCSTCATCMEYDQQQVNYQYAQQHAGNRRMDAQRRLADDDYWANYYANGGNDDAAAAAAAADDAVYGDDAYGDDAGNGDDAYRDDAVAYGDDANQAGDDAYSYGTSKPTASPTVFPTISPTISPTASPTEEGDDFYAFVDDDFYKDDDSAGGNAKSYNSNCRFSSFCYNYRSVCKTYNANDKDFPNYFSCSQFEIGNQVVYLGPHCNDDGHSITLGVFDDEECSDYLGDIANMQDFTGIPFNEDSLSFYYPQTCVSCANKVRIIGRQTLWILPRSFLISVPSSQS